MRELISSQWPMAKLVAEAYLKNSKPVEKKSEEEIKDEEIKVKPLLPTGCGNHVDLYA